QETKEQFNDQQKPESSGQRHHSPGVDGKSLEDLLGRIGDLGKVKIRHQQRGCEEQGEEVVERTDEECDLQLAGSRLPRTPEETAGKDAYGGNGPTHCWNSREPCRMCLGNGWNHWAKGAEVRQGVKR